MPSLPVLTRRFPRIHRWSRRHRRAIAALLAGAGVLLALGSLQGAPPPPAPTVDAGIAGALRTGEVAVPVELASSPVASVLVPGDLIDLIATSPDGTSSVLATAARVLRTPPVPGVGSTPVLVVAVDRSVGATLASGSAMNSGVAVIIRGDRDAAAPAGVTAK